MPSRILDRSGIALRLPDRGVLIRTTRTTTGVTALCRSPGSIDCRRFTGEKGESNSDRVIARPRSTPRNPHFPVLGVAPGNAERAASYSFLLILAPIATASFLVGCDLKVPGGGLADRCADIMKVAIPSADIDIDKRTSKSPSIDTIIAQVTGTRTDMPEGSPLPRDLAVECEFTNGVLTAFRWTQGGPRQHP